MPKLNRRAILPDAPAVLARVEQMMEVLRRTSIYDGWKLDEGRAEQALQYFRRAAHEGWPDDDGDKEWPAVLDFVYDYGQSLEWLMFGDPTCLISRAARAA